MSEVTKIQWTDASLSPWWGCTKVSPGCLNCYAEGLDARFHGGEHWGKGNPRKRIASFEKNALALDRKAKRLGKRLKVFPSMCDPFDPEVPIEWLAHFLDVMRRTPNLNWLVLTKRPGLWQGGIYAVMNSLRLLSTQERGRYGDNWELWDWLVDWNTGSAPHNVWIGTSAEDQTRADERIPQLLNIPAKVRFLSIEPMIGPVKLPFINFPRAWEIAKSAPMEAHHEKCSFRTQAGGLLCDCHVLNSVNPMEGIHWVICGCESGANRRPMKMQWAMHLREHCEANYVPFFMKQMSDTTKKVTGDIDRFPAYLQVREFPGEVER